MKKLRIGMIKHIPIPWEVEANLLTFEKFAQQAYNNGVNLLMTCECYLDGYCSRGTGNAGPFDPIRFKEITLDINNSDVIDRVRNIADKYSMHILLGFTSKNKDGSSNSALFIDDNGNDIGIYHKTHLQNHDLVYVAGDDLPVFDTKFGKMGIMICADRRWPETARVMKIKKAEIILNPTYGMNHYENEMWMRTRAYENEIWIAFAHPSQSLILNTHGNVDAKYISNVSGLLVHDIDLEDIPDNMFKDRRPELYGVI